MGGRWGAPPPLGPPFFVASGEGFFSLFSPRPRSGRGAGGEGVSCQLRPPSVAPAKAGVQSCGSFCRLRRRFFFAKRLAPTGGWGGKTQPLALRAPHASGGELFARTKSSTKMLPPVALRGLGIAATPPKLFPYREPITRWVCFPAPSPRRNVFNLSDAVRTGLRPVLFFLHCHKATWAAQAHPAVRLPKCSREQQHSRHCERSEAIQTIERMSDCGLRPYPTYISQ